MTGQAIVTIDGKQWAVSVATTPAELTSGLSGVASMAAGTGMLFDMGSDQNSIPINMNQMLFALDIVFINSTAGVVGVLHDVQPEDKARFQAGISAGARYFLEVNAGEASEIVGGESVSFGNGGNIQQPGVVTPAFWGLFLTGIVTIVTGTLVTKKILRID